MKKLFAKVLVALFGGQPLVPLGPVEIATPETARVASSHGRALAMFAPHVNEATDGSCGECSLYKSVEGKKCCVSIKKPSIISGMFAHKLYCTSQEVPNLRGTYDLAALMKGNVEFSFLKDEQEEERAAFAFRKLQLPASCVA